MLRFGGRALPYVPHRLRDWLVPHFLPKHDEVSRATRFESIVAGGVPCEWFFAPDETGDGRVLIYLHGGGYAIGSTDTHRNLISRLRAAAGVPVLAPNYRLAPKHRFGAQIEDATAVYDWLVERGHPPSKIAVAGESAGGHLTLSTLLALRDRKRPLPSSAVLISPWLQLDTRHPILRRDEPDDYITTTALKCCADWFVTSVDDLKNPLAAPVHADLTGLPPLLVQAGGCETLLDDAIHIAARARAHGVAVTLDVEPDMVHAFHVFPTVFTRAQAAIERAAAFMRRHIDT